MKVCCSIFGLDDDLDTVEMIQEAFDKNGVTNYRFFTCEKEYIKYIQTETPDIAIIDHYLDGVSVGFDVMEKIFELNNKSPMMPRCKVIIMSGRNDEEMLIRYINRGVFKYIYKGDIDFLEQLVEYVTLAVDKVKALYSLIEKHHQRMVELRKI